MTSSLLARVKRETLLLEAVMNVTTPCDRLLMEMDSNSWDMSLVEDHWRTAISRIRNEFHRLRRKKGRAE